MVLSPLISKTHQLSLTGNLLYMLVLCYLSFGVRLGVRFGAAQELLVNPRKFHFLVLCIIYVLYMFYIYIYIYFSRHVVVV